MTTTAPITVADVEATFRERFSDVVRAIEENGASWHVSSQGGGELAAQPVPGSATIIVRGREDRGFGIVITETKLRGLRGKTYRLDDLCDPQQNWEFLDELSRRIRSPGYSRTQVNGHVYGSPTGKWGKHKRRDRSEPWHGDAY